jgi:cytochrome d ubiquinol oxidase subunit I
LWWSYTGVLVVYVAMSVCVTVVLRSMGRRWRAGDEDLHSAYTPDAVDAQQGAELVS